MYELFKWAKEFGITNLILLIESATIFLLIYMIYKLKLFDRDPSNLQNRLNSFNDELEKVREKIDRLSKDLNSLTDLIKENEQSGKITQVVRIVEKVKEDLIELKTIVTLWLGGKK